MSKQKKSIQETIQKELPEFAEECNTLSADELNNRLAQCAKDAETIEEAKESDEAYETAKAQVIALGAPYKDGKKMIRLKSRYLISLLKDRGQSV